MMQIYIDEFGNKCAFDDSRVDVIQPSWNICQPKDDGTYYDAYNIDGTPDLTFIVKEDVPEMITMRQVRLYLLSIDLLDDVELIVSTNRAWQIEWEYANEVHRDNKLINVLQDNLGLDSNTIDRMFIDASRL